MRCAAPARRASSPAPTRPGGWPRRCARGDPAARAGELPLGRARRGGRRARRPPPRGRPRARRLASRLAGDPRARRRRGAHAAARRARGLGVPGCGAAALRGARQRAPSRRALPRLARRPRRRRQVREPERADRRRTPGLAARRRRRRAAARPLPRPHDRAVRGVRTRAGTAGAVAREPRGMARHASPAALDAARDAFRGDRPRDHVPSRLARRAPAVPVAALRLGSRSRLGRHGARPRLAPRDRRRAAGAPRVRNRRERVPGRRRDRGGARVPRQPAVSLERGCAGDARDAPEAAAVRVCVIAEYYPRPHDPASGVWAHRQALAARAAGADVRVVVLDRPLRARPAALLKELRAATRRPRAVTLDGIEVEYARFFSPPRRLSYARWHRWARRPLAKALERGPRPDIVHAHYAHLAGAAALSWTHERRIPLAVSVHGGDVLVPELARVSTDVLRAASAVMCNSRGTLRRAAALAGDDGHMRVVHLGTDVPAEADLPPKHDQPTIATLANVDPRKRHEDVLHALPRLPNVRWSVIGDGPALPALETLTRELGLSDRVRFAGRLAPPDALEELARCHAMALPSIDEAFGVAYVEALARGVPAIGCKGEDGPEEIASLTEGMLLVPPRDPEAIEEAIRGALTNADLPAKARAGAAAHFTWERCGRETVAAYEEALARR